MNADTGAQDDGRTAEQKRPGRGEDARGLPRYPIAPAALIGRLAVDRRHQGRRLGNGLLMDAVARSSRADAAIFALIVDATDEQAGRFYRRCGFLSASARPSRMYLPVATALKAPRGDA